MNQSERDALREKHRKNSPLEPICKKCDLTQVTYLESMAENVSILCGWTESVEHDFTEWIWWCDECDVEWPCDVIKVLDSSVNRKAVVAETLRFVADILWDDPDILSTADTIEHTDIWRSSTCPLCAEVDCDDHCPLREERFHIQTKYVPPEVLSRLKNMGLEGNGFDVVETTVILHDPKWKGKL
jgi:hypothetical protein